MKPISTFTHGVADYATSAMLLVLPMALGISGAGQTLLVAAGAAMLCQALVTRYELGLVKLVPMPVHLAMDVVMGVLLLAAPFLLVELENPVVTALFVLVGLAEIGAGLLTQSQSQPSSLPVGGAV